MLHSHNRNFCSHYKFYRLFLSMVLVAVGLQYAGDVSAYPNGISGYSGEARDCTLCHTNSGTVTVSLTPDSGSTTVEPGSISSYTLTLTGGPAAVAGFDIHTDGGTIIDTNPSGTKILNAELVHSSPNNMSGNSISWTLNWEVPTAEGTYTLYAAALSGNGNGGTSGDATGTATLQVTVAGVSNQPPIAAISAPATDLEGVDVTFDGSGSSDPDGSIVSYDWDFDDGSMGSGSSVTHAFAAGTYTVSLTVTDNNGATDTASVNIDIVTPNQPPVALISGPNTGTEGVAVSFSASGSSDIDGSIVAYDWDFGDNSAGSGVEVSHTYVAGNYTVTLTVTDDAGATGQDTLQISITAPNEPQPPVADPGGPYTGTVGEAIQFDGTGSNDMDGSIQGYEWTFGDGNSATGPGPVHTYTAAGSYTVTLTVTDDQGLTGSADTSAEISALPTEPQPPVANAGGPYTGVAGTAILLDGSASSDPDGTIQSYEWDFGDGSSGSGVGPVHTYAAQGQYTITLTVTDDQGLTSNAETTADISAETTTPTPEDTPEQLYNKWCSACHGPEGKGGKAGSVTGESADDILEAIREEKDMAFLSDVLSESDIEAIAGYLESFKYGDDERDHDSCQRERHEGDHDGRRSEREDSSRNSCDKDGNKGDHQDKGGNKGNDQNKDKSSNPFSLSEDNASAGTGSGGGATGWFLLCLLPLAFARNRAK